TARRAQPKRRVDELDASPSAPRSGVAEGEACGQGGNAPGCTSPPGVRERARPHAERLHVLAREPAGLRRLVREAPLVTSYPPQRGGSVTDGASFGWMRLVSRSWVVRSCEELEGGGVLDEGR